MIPSDRRWRILEHDPAGGAWNMAVDEALLSSVEENPVFRIYGWNEWTLSLGRFQDPEGDLLPAFLADPSFPVVRRMTGGGAILHGGELTYSLVLHQDDLGTGDVKESFRLLCGFLHRFYRKLGLESLFAGDAAALITGTYGSVESPGVTGVDGPIDGRRVSGAAQPPALGLKTPFCYAGREIYDVVIRGMAHSDGAMPASGFSKIGGNAQRRFRKVIFQHGSIPIVLNRMGLQRIFPEKDLPPGGDITSLVDLGAAEQPDAGAGSGRNRLVTLLREAFTELAAEDLHTDRVETDTMTEKERAAAASLENEVYRSTGWTFHRTRS